MLGFSEKNIVEAPDRSILTKVAGKIVDRGLSVPAVFALELMRPLAFIGSQALVFFGPMITTFVRAQTYYEITELLEDHHNVSFLVDEIERLDAEAEALRRSSQSIDKNANDPAKALPSQDH